MSIIIVYDSTGFIFFQGMSILKEPQGVPFIWADIPSGKQIKLTDGIGVDVSVTPNVAILEDIPKTEIEILQADQVRQLERTTQTEAEYLDFQSYVLETLGGM